ncbi:alpha-2-macroglobulin family protein [Succinivibrio dextrinosolvens]|uniref:alpha-2-macroglobulin family protein n=1 Tax=Succinivibrio dextrinosolvens TaxID=83771 RepID=UPI0004E1A40C|nr:MG2 domain-containing protein [Succinivibrio dextrinosolvens]
MNIRSKILILSALTAASIEANCAEALPKKNQDSALKIQRIIDQNSQGTATSCLIFNDEMSDIQQPDILKKKLLLKDSKGNEVNSISPFVSERKLCLSGLKFGENYELTIKKGIEGFNTRTNDKDLSVKFKTSDAKSSVSFTNGLVLPMNNSESISINSINMQSFKLSVFRIATSDIPRASLFTLLDNRLDKWQINSLLDNYGEFIKSKVYKLPQKKNERITTKVNISDLRDNLKDGLFVLLITAADKNDGDSLYELAPDYDSLALSKLLFITDIGATAYRGALGLDIAVRSLKSAKPKSGAKVELLSSGNEVLGVTTTDSNGYAHFDEKLLSGTNSREPAAVLITDNKDTFPLDLRSENLYLEDAATDNEYADDNDRTIYSRLIKQSKYRIYAFTQRSLLRPGEKVYYQAHVRNADLSAAPLKALKLTIYKPDFTVLKEVTLDKPHAGVFDYEFTLSDNAALGEYRIELGYDKKQVLSSSKFTVAAFKPGSINAKFLSEKDILKDGDSIEIESKYNYGSLASDLNVDGYYLIKPDNHPVDKFKDYYFGLNEDIVPDHIKNLSIDSGKTSKKGRYTFTPSVAMAKYPQMLELSLNIMDPASDMYYLNHEYKYAFDYPMLGVKKIKNNSSDTEFNVVMCRQDGALLDGNAQYVIQKRNISYQYIFENNSWKFLKNEYRTPVTSGDITLSTDIRKNGIKADLKDGAYVLEVTDNKTGFNTSYNFFVGSYSNFNPNSPDRFVLTSDKEEYKTGDTAVLSFESEFDGYADLVLGNNGVNRLTHYEIKKGLNEIKLKVDESFNYGTYALLTTFSAMDNPYKTAARAVGLNYIKVDTSKSELELTSTLDNINQENTLIKPNSKLNFEVMVKNKDNSKLEDETYVTATLVDNGILAINKHKAPNLIKALAGKESLKTTIVDMYGHIIREIKGDGQGYGDEMMSGENAAALSNINDNILSLYTKAVKVQNGKARIDFELPSVSTTATLMLTAYNSHKVGSAFLEVPIKDKAVTTLNMPYYLHNDDELNAILGLDNLSSDKSVFSYEVKCSGTLKCDAKGEFHADKNAKDKTAVEIKALSEGDGFVEYKVKADDYSFSNKRNIKVLNRSFAINENSIVSIPAKSSSDIKLTQNFVDNTPAKVILGGMPLCDNKALLKSLDFEYRNSFFDEVSKGRILLNTLQNMENKNSQEYKDYQRYLSDIIDYVESHISMQGYVNYNFYNYEASKYAAVYASEFLYEAYKDGFDVNSATLEYLEKALARNLNDDNDTVAAYAMKLAASQGVNVNTSLTYNFDHREIKSINALCNYAQAFSLYGDRQRQSEALKQASDNLKTLLKLKQRYLEAKELKKRQEIFKEIKAYQPFYINTVSFDVLTLLKEKLNADENTDVAPLLSNLNDNALKDGYLDNQSKAVISELSTKYSKSITKIDTKVENGVIKVRNDSDKNAVASVQVTGKVAGDIVNPDSLSLHVWYFDKNGKALNNDSVLKVNDDIVVLVSAKSKEISDSRAYVNLKLPSNMMFLRKIDSKETKKEFTFLQEYNLNENYQMETALSDASYNVSGELNGRPLTFAFIMKAAYKGKSAPLMSRLTQKTVTLKQYYYSDPMALKVTDESDKPVKTDNK